MYYGFDAHPLLYVTAALAIFGMPMMLIFMTAMKMISGSQLRSSATSVAKTREVVKRDVSARDVGPTAGPTLRPVSKRVVRRRALEIRWVSLPVETDSNR